MIDAILVLNAGSSSLKFALFPSADRPTRATVVCEGQCSDIGHKIRLRASDAAGQPLIDRELAGETTHEQALARILAWQAERFPEHQPIAAAHRVVHGGTRYAGPVVIDEAVLTELRKLIPLAPLHQPHHIAAIEAFAKLHPKLPQVACFDTSFHQAEPTVATTFALPRRLTEEGIRRYGFHGLSYEYIASVLAEVVGPELAEGRVVVAHLGSGASLCAMHHRRSVANTMGFTALDGLPMSRRCGALDPGVVLYLVQEKGMSASAVSDLLYQSSGLLGVSGLSDDMKTLLESDRPNAREAVELFVYRIGREIGSLAAALGGVDALVFTAGIGEHAPEIRRRVCEAAAWLGFEIDVEANAAGGPKLTKADCAPSAWVIPTDEDLMIARHAWSLLDRQTAPAKAETST